MMSRKVAGSRGALGVAIVAAVMIAGCARWADPPRYGSLQRDGDRRFDFAHGIQLFEVDNGMRFAILRDDRSNVATVDVRYDVGAKDDPPGRAGLAHLVEHLLFEPRATPDAAPLSVEIEAIALATNAETSWDGTHYYASVPVAQLDQMIALEGRRLATTCAQLDDATIARERDVVIAENAERAGPRAALYQDVLGAIYGADHPYARPVSSDEIAGVTRAEICGFLAAQYAPARASLVVTGDVDVEHVRQLIGRTFGPIARGRTIAPARRAPPPPLDGQTVRLTGPVERPTALVAFATPPMGARGRAAGLLASVRLAQALDELDADADWVLDTQVELMGDARAPTLVAVLTVREPDQLEAATDEVYARADAMLRGPGGDLDLVRTLMALGFMDSWDDAGARGPWIAEFLQYAEHDRFMLEELRGLAAPWPTLMQPLAGRFSPPRSRRVLITPGGGGRRAGAVAAAAHGDHVWRLPVDPAEADGPLRVVADDPGPMLSRYTLANGLSVELAPDDTAAVIDARLVFPAGRAHADPAHPLVPTAAAVFLEFDAEGFYERKELDKLEWALERGTVADVDVDDTATTFQVRGLPHFGDWHVWYLSALLDRGRYNDTTLAAIHRVGRRLTGAAARAKATDDTAARTFLTRVYGVDHPFARPPVALGPAYTALSAAELGAWKRAHYRPRGATLIVSGKFDVAAMKREIDELFGPWADVAPAPLPAIPAIAPTPTPSWLAVEARDALQVDATLAFALAPAPRQGPARLLVEEMLADQLRDVREALGASYGVYPRLALAPGVGGALFVEGQLDEGQAGAAVARMLATIATLRTDEAVRRDAFVRARRALVARASMRQAGAHAVADERTRAAAVGVGDDVSVALARRLAGVTLAEVTAVLTDSLGPERMVVRLTGRLAAVDAAFAALGQTPERFLEPAAPAPDPSRARPRPRPTTPAPTDDDHAPAERLAVDRWDSDGNRHDGLFQGDRAIARDAFLRTAGRTDLIDRMSARWWLRVGLGAGAVATVLGGVAIAATARSCDGVVDLPGPIREVQVCIDERDSQHNLGGAVIVGGAVLAVAAFYLSDRAPTKAELRQAASRYNYRHGGAAAPGAVSGVRLAPTVSPDGVGVIVAGHF
ncbi:MAG: insulinase family protein [Myxococcales bacterium]|nr:insulinase family protein [Myxococcales bacterium]